jgi:23S rRNA (adenine2503-C2)-methyltransferase
LLDLKSLFPDEIKNKIKEIGEPGFRGDQIFNWVSKGVDSFDEMVNMPKSLKSKMEDVFNLTRNEIIAKQVSSDGTVKYAMKLLDGKIIESVLMKYHHGYSICISTQVGCRMNCSFCASTIGGLERNLTAGEMLGQVLTAQRDQGIRVSNIVLMGSGEPFDNYDNVIRFIRLAHEEKGLGISYRSITVSTSGVVPGIYRLSEEDIPITLAVSLHSPDNVSRSGIMPVNKKYPIEELLEACRVYVKVTGKRITFEYALMKGINDDMDSFRKTAKLLKGLNCHVNIIGYNSVEERDFKTSERAVQQKFKEFLESRGIAASIRRTLGEDIDAACGQLRNNLKTNI